jgi:methionyl-tRNA formyltransferase
MLNVHASLLPRWRGAAPIIYAIADGDRKTGITIMKISPDKFDVGDIINQESVEIHPNMKMRELYTTLGKLGANSLINTLETLPHSLCTAKPQPSDGVTYAPKVNASLACVKWDKMTSHQVYNLERALDGVFHLQTSWNGTPVKLMNINKHGSDSKKYDKVHPGFVDYDKQRKVLKILCSDFQFITVKKVGVLGKRVMTSGDFHNGYVKKEAPDCRYFQ